MDRNAVITVACALIEEMGISLGDRSGSHRQAGPVDLERKGLTFSAAG